MCSAPSMVRLITAYQTISDYLDNLCDRMETQSSESMDCLHLSMLDALDPNGTIHDYYRLYYIKDDGGYLVKLVETCRAELSKLPSYDHVKEYALDYAKLYSSMQSFKHISSDEREKKLFYWADSANILHKELFPWEFCAAAGSTLGIFSLFAASSNPHLGKNEIDGLREAYFPWICCLHILLDYFIDYNEDMDNKELNFIQYYHNDSVTWERLKYFTDQSLLNASHIIYPDFHSTIILGLLAMYLSDSKTIMSNLNTITYRIISSYGIKLKLMYSLCSKLRKSMSI